MATSWIEGKVAIVTGAARGLGRGFADALGRSGASLALGDRLAEVRDVAADIASRHGIDARGWRRDMSEPPDVWRLVDDAVEAFGGVDILVNNAGIWAPTKATDPLDASATTFDDVFAVNTRGVFLAGRAVMPIMLGRGDGHIVNIVTDHVYTEPQRPTGGGATMDVYDASKWALNGMTLAWAAALAPTVRVNGLCMGATDSLMLRSLFEPDGPPAETVARWKRPEQLGEFLVELLEEGPSGRTGWNLPVWVDDPIVMPELTADWAMRVGTMTAAFS
ncbi:MAG: SDR family NAD(P)-dependent oxidoreductase [Ilumatobacteraceae bacterium]